jgi:hypothetical protein
MEISIWSGRSIEEKWLINKCAPARRSGESILSRWYLDSYHLEIALLHEPLGGGLGAYRESQ